jgi:5-methyltetrahydrofolate--homocysteine methyltransferase
VAAIVEANGYRVVDMGTSVEPVRIVNAVKKHKPIALIGSSLMTTTRNAFLITADLLKKEGMSIPFIGGGGACDDSFARQRDLIYAKDPNSVVKALDSLI